MIELIKIIFDILKTRSFRLFNLIFIIKIILFFKNLIQLLTLFDKSL